MTLEVPLAPITTWHWEVTKRCNLKCLHCILGDGPFPRELNTGEVLEAVEVIVKLGGKFLRITGGEPLLRKDLPLLLTKAAALGLGSGFITNGTLFTPDLLDLVARTNAEVTVSIDGLEPVHDRIRGIGSFARAKGALQGLIERGVEVAVSVTITRLNHDQIIELVDQLLALGVERLHFNDLNNQGRANDNLELLARGTDPQAALEELIAQLSTRVGYNQLEIVSQKGCSVSPETIYLAANGDLFPCVELALAGGFVALGNIKNVKVPAIQRFYRSLSPPRGCRYQNVYLPGVSICFNQFPICPLLEGAK